jgi:hypothetical protein
VTRARTYARVVHPSGGTAWFYLAANDRVTGTTAMFTASARLPVRPLIPVIDVYAHLVVSSVWRHGKDFSIYRPPSFPPRVWVGTRATRRGRVPVSVSRQVAIFRFDTGIARCPLGWNDGDVAREKALTRLNSRRSPAASRSSSVQHGRTS